MVAQKTCRCNCGYTCGGPGACNLPIDECMDQHFKRDCDHDFRGPLVEIDFMGCKAQSVTCQKCGMPAITHDLRVGP